jgi:hypothetical protein
MHFQCEFKHWHMHHCHTKHTANLTEQPGGDGTTGQGWDSREIVEGRQDSGCMPPPACSCTPLTGKWCGSRVAGAKGNQDPHCMLVCPWALQIAQILNQIQCTLRKLINFIVDECGLVAVSLTSQWCARSSLEYDMPSWFDVLSHWVMHGWLSTTEQSGYNLATIWPTIQLIIAIKQGLSLLLSWIQTDHNMHCIVYPIWD